MGYAVKQLRSGRQSFSPDASFFTGRLPENLIRFIQSPPTFAAEIRSENDYGPQAEIEIAAKRADYFEAGTPVVWDVDTIAKCVHAYKISEPYLFKTFRPGEIANAEPAVPGWQIPVDKIFSI